VIDVDRRDLLLLDRYPEDDDELWWTVYFLWGVRIPRVAVCEGHSAPFDVFADAYFARYDTMVVKASRGLAGKTFLFATLVATEAALLASPVTLLGGSLEQSGYAHEYTKNFWDFIGAPAHMLKSDPTHRKTTLNNDGELVVLAASTKSARGSHRPRLRLDEIDEMDRKVLSAALGTPMTQKGVTPQTLLGSTHQYPNGTMTWILEEMAPEKGWPVHEWCYRETRRDDPEQTTLDRDGDLVPAGWLLDDEIERAKGRVPSAMWEIEYELGEPSIEGRAIIREKVDATFDPELGVFEGVPNEYIEIEEPDPAGTYSTSADWAKDVDWTVIATFRTDVRPWRCVAWERTGRQPWPVMVGKLEERLRRYPPQIDEKRRLLSVAHDATGLGDVIDDYVDVEIDGYRPDGVKLVGQRRADLFTDYIAAIEDDAIRYPRIRFAYDEHRYATLSDLYGRGSSDHPPDSFVAGALGWGTRSTQPSEAAAPAGPRAPSKYRSPR